ncbi:MAG: TonB-dependent receptor [Flavobacteriia bacterium]|nr:TonB-dependent receptor [Flavobacteriia bacterium]
MIFIFILSSVFSQEGIISGKILDNKNKLIPNCKIIIKETNKIYFSDEKGNFKTDSIPYGDYTIQFYAELYVVKNEKFQLNQKKLSLEIKLELESMTLKEIEEVKVVKSLNTKGFTLRMRSIDGVMLSQGKKNEVIVLDDVLANKATNSSRQIYSKIPGLNIWESDGAGMQLGIGGRGLSPSRTSNFNTRQNGYDISADALGYPESYYTPPSEAIQEIQLIRGAASLQFGSQFGGLLNFVTKTGNKEKTVELTTRQSIGSFNLWNNFISLGGSHKTWNYYTYYQYKKGDDWRPNSQFNMHVGGINLIKYLNENNLIRIEFTKMYSLSKQPGGLTDVHFKQDASVSLRNRNWFEVDWNLASLSFDHEFSKNSMINTRFFGLLASRKALGFLGEINRVDPLKERDLIWGDFKNFGNETRYLLKYKLFNKSSVLLVGARYYQGNNQSRQGWSNDGDGPDFSYINPDNLEGSSYKFPSKNIAFFAEHIFYITNKLAITPGFRYEYISTKANGSYRETIENLAGTIIFDTNYTDNRVNNRDFLLGGIGINYHFKKWLELYSNFSQNYRSINFTDMQIQNANFKIDPNLKDERGYNFDFGFRGGVLNKLNFDVSVFILSYANRIGTCIKVDEKLYNTYQYRTNISESLTKGVEALVETDLWKVLINDTSDFSFKTFINVSLIDAKYIRSKEKAFENKNVELVPPISYKCGVSFSYKTFSLAFQYSFTQEHFSDATNSEHQANAVNGLIPAYSVMDLSCKWKIKWLQLETGINNLMNEKYFTRRATGYPGPGIMPSLPRNFYLTLQIQI